MIQTDRLTLRPFLDWDFEELFEYYRRADVARYLYWEPMDEAQTQLALQRKRNETTLGKEGDALSLAVWCNELQQLIGDMSLFYRSETHAQGEIGFVFNPAFAGQGYATEAASAVLGIGFRQFKLHRIYGRCDTRNSASWQLMQRLGMRREAHFLQNEKFKGEWGDEYQYALLHTEYPSTIP